jgi:hypothetical protein
MNCSRILISLLVCVFPALLSAQNPFGYVDCPNPNNSGCPTTNLSGAVNVTGWALSTYTVSSVGIYRAPVPGESGLVFIQYANFIAGSRPDVAAAYPSYPNNNWGFGTQVVSNLLPDSNGDGGHGNGNYTLYVIAYDPNGRNTTIGTISISVDNRDSVLPFGTIDTPADGATISGTAYVNFGWALAPQPYQIPTNGSTIWVYIDGQVVGHPTYNQYRSDIASLFPGLYNSNGAVGFFYINTTLYSPLGLHTISWAVYDNAGHAAGIGSRYFSVQGATDTFGFRNGNVAGGGSGASYTLNDNIARTVTGISCSGGLSCTNATCSVSGSNGGVSATLQNASATSADVSVTANYISLPGNGTRTLTCTDSDPQYGSRSIFASLSVYDATPVVTSVERYNGPPGNHAFVQGEGGVGVRILGHNLGASGQLFVSGSGVSVTSVSWWHPDGSEIDANFNIDITALGTYTVTVSSNGVSGSGFFQGGGSIRTGNGTMVVGACVPQVQITNRPISITPSTSRPGTYQAVLTSTASPPGGVYYWSTDNPGMVGFLTPASGSSANQVTLGIASTNDHATIFLTYVSPCGSGIQVTDSFVFALGNDTTAVGWVDGSVITIPDPSTAGDQTVPLQLNDPLQCPGLIASWVDLGRNGYTSSYDSGTLEYANSFLLNRSANQPPPATLTSSDDLMNGGNYRLYQRFQAYYETNAGVINPATVMFLQTKAVVGNTPEPCSGQQVMGVATQANSDNGLEFVTGAHDLVYQINEGRLGLDGQNANYYLNGVTTPWIWTAIQFDANGKTRAFVQGDIFSNISIFPSMQIYTGTFGLPPIPQQDWHVFNGLGESYYYNRPQ